MEVREYYFVDALSLFIIKFVAHLGVAFRSRKVEQKSINQSRSCVCIGNKAMERLLGEQELNFKQMKGI